MKFTHKQKSKKLRASAMLGPIVFWTLLGLSSLYTKNYNEKIIKNYIKNDLKYEMANQEQILGIKYLGTPNIEYHMQPEIINLAPGAYDAETDTIYINLHLLTERKSLKQLGFLKRDPRMKERRKFGLKKARKAPQWAKR